MNKKTINKIISKKFYEFTESITDSYVKELVKNNTLITGGCIASMFLNEKVNDFDLYFTNKETVIAVSNYYLEKFNKENNRSGRISIESERVKIIFDGEAIANDVDIESIHELGDTIEIKNDEGEKYRPVYISENAITLSCEIQIIIRFYGESKEIHDNYDFIHCTNYWTSINNELVTNLKAMESLITKNLVYIGSKYPLASIIRIRKFISRGWRINAGQILKMSFQLSLLDLTDVNTLKDQLIGVDLAYFAQLIEWLLKKEGEVTYPYLAEIIERVF